MGAVGERRSRIALGIAALTVLAAALRFWALQFGLPRTMARPDEEAITAIAARIVLVGPNPHFFDYPTLFMYVVALVEKWWPGGRAVFDDVLPAMIARTISAALGAASVPVLFAAARRLFSLRAAFGASALLAVAFLHVRDSHFGVTDVPMTFMVLVAFLAIVSLPLDPAHWWNVLAAAVLCGLATSTKYNAALIATPLFVALAWSKSPAWLYGVAVAAMAAGFVAGTPYALIARGKFLEDLSGLQAHLASGHGADQGFGWTHHLTFTLRYGLGLPFLLAALAGGAWLAAYDRRRALLVLSFPVLYYIGMGSGRTVFMRHMLPVVPFAALLSGFLVDRVAGLFRGPERAALRERGRSATVSGSRQMASMFAFALTALIGYDSATRSIAFDRLLARRDSRTIAAEMLEARYPQGTAVYQNGTVYGRVQLWPEGIFPQTPLERLPQLVIVHSSPLVAYRDEPAALRAVLAERYRTLGKIDVENHSSEAGAVFDQQDAFFAPIAGFDRFVRPGPTLEIFERIDR